MFNCDMPEEEIVEQNDGNNDDIFVQLENNWHRRGEEVRNELVKKYFTY